MISSLETRSPGRLEQHAKHVESARTDFDRSQSVTFIPTEQTPPVEAEPLEQENLVRGKCFHAPSCPRF
jgi:hypothetical protein